MELRHSYLLAHDYDGTQADTDESCPGGVNVSESYERGISELFGDRKAAEFRENGGHNHRAPGDIVDDLFPSGTPERRRHLTDLLVETVVDREVRQIGTPLRDWATWPRQTEGFLHYWERLDELRERARSDGFSIERAVISAGYRRFILKSYEEWGATPPEILITDDEMRAVQYPREAIEKRKPRPFPFAVAQAEWLERTGGFSIDRARDSWGRRLFIGNDPVKDGGLAESMGAEFMLFELAGTEGPRTINDFRKLADRLEQSWEALREGRPLSEVLEVTEPDPELVRQR
jgi:hypothetical protein